MRKRRWRKKKNEIVKVKWGKEDKMAEEEEKLDVKSKGRKEEQEVKN